MGQTAMHYCCVTGSNMSLVQLLTSAPDFDAEVKDFEGNTALLLATKRGLIAIMTRLLGRNRANFGCNHFTTAAVCLMNWPNLQWDCY